MTWPAPGRFPVNHAGGRVRDQVWPDLVSATDPLAATGFASLDQLIELVSDITHRTTAPRLRILLGTEPFSTARVAFGSPESLFTEEVRRYWTEERHVSLRLSAKIVEAVRALDDGWLEVRFLPGATRLHAKVYLGSRAATVGSSNFTDAGLRTQFEANTRFERTGDRERYDDLRVVANNYWDVGIDWNQQFRALLDDLLQTVSWQDALARACADLLEGQWAASYLAGTTGTSTLWPSQVAGIAEALWVVENVGSVLVADATGSGKTRMGAHLTRAVRDRLWSTGRVRRDLTVLVCPPAVEPAWQREALDCGISLRIVSQGLLSHRSSPAGRRVEADEVAAAQILAIDEAHNFLAESSNRSREVRAAPADHVLMFTATPINRGAADLLSLVDLLGADNFQDESLELLERLNHGAVAETLTDPERDLLRAEIQRFTVRRTKATLNAMVDQAPEHYVHPETGRPSRYPEHQTRTYPTRESADDERLAEQIKVDAAALRGLMMLGQRIAVPDSRRRQYTDERWLRMRIDSAAGLAAYHVRSAMRSSRAALVEHVEGTGEAVHRFELVGLVKPQPSGNMLQRIGKLTRPPVIDLQCDVPAWLADPDAWQEECDAELARYRRIRALALELSDRRERAKAAVVRSLAGRHQRVIAFDRHPITLAVIEQVLDLPPDVPVYAATGAATKARKQVRERFARTSTEPGVALCTEAMNEGINLQGASAIVHFDMPTTLRVVEQRVGRVDRMDSPYESIEVWWPDDGPSFATRADEQLHARNAESSSLLGSNLHIPRRHDDDNPVVTADTFLMQQQQMEWDGLRDALEPVRSLVSGPTAVVPRDVYDSQRESTHRVLTRISTSTVRADHAWAFFAIRGTTTGAPRWLLLEGDDAPPVTGLDAISDRMRQLLAGDPPSRLLDEACAAMLDQFLARAAGAEFQLLPRLSQRALEQMRGLCDRWGDSAASALSFVDADRWRELAQLAIPDDGSHAADPHQVATEWLRLVKPIRREVRARHPRRRYSRLADITPSLRDTPLPLSEVEAAMTGLPVVEPLDQRVSACILSVPD